LTAREREVASLVAQGMSNREIAESLVIGERTVESHVSSIFNKLGFTRRAEVRRWVKEQGLD
jgi:non-specific serine/threonine protein kinase